jgi:hypothetical protein
MSKERLSELQKWILTSTYKVMTLCDKTDFTLKIFSNFSKDLCINNHTKGECNDICKREFIAGRSYNAFRLYKEDILLDYYHFKITRKRTSLFKLVCFEDNDENNKAHVAVKRSLESLDKKIYYFILFTYIKLHSNTNRKRNKQIKRADKLICIDFFS